MKYNREHNPYIDAQADTIKKRLPEHLISLIRVDTRSELNKEAEAVNLIAAICRKYGIEYSIAEPYLGKASLIAVIRGCNPCNDGILLLSHIDTADWDQKEWQYHPLSGKIKNNKIYGRGAIDCKSLVAIWLNIMIEISQSGVQPEKDVFFIVSSDEESGGIWGLKWIVDNTDVISKCRFAINEGGGYAIPTPKGIYLTCQYGEKGSNKFGVPGVMPEGQHIVKGKGIKNRLGNLSNRFEYLYWRHILKDSSIKPDLINSYFDTISKDGDDSLLLSFINNDSSLIKNALYTYGIIQAEELSHSEATISGRNSLLFKLIRKTAKDFGYKGVISVITKGSSDSRFLRERGIDTYGFFPVGLRENIFSMHGRDEFIHTESLLESYELLYQVVTGYINRQRIL